MCSRIFGEIILMLFALLAGGNGSGGKLNPAVTAGLFITGFLYVPTFHHFYPFRVLDNVNCLYVRA
jgi:hypothetical protein